MHTKAAAGIRRKILTQASIAKELSVTPQAVSDWMHGRSRPSPALMMRIEDLYGVPMRHWLEPADEEPKNGTENS